MSKFFNSIKSFVHSISTSDHYAAYDPSRPAGQDDTAPLATNEDRRSSSSSVGSGYVPGMRSAQLSSSSTNLAGGNGSKDAISLTDMAPIPSPELSWNRIDTWIEHNYPELFDQILGGATNNDLNDFEHDLDCVLPADVRESYRIHDGQERGAMPTGLFFGIALLDLEQISEEWTIWKQTAVYVDELAHRTKSKASKASSSVPPVNPRNQTSWMEQQTSFPPDTIQSVYAHPAWIPLAKDQDGNNIAVDLAPGPKGRVGQVILFGRDFDTKYVVSPSWGDFLAQFAADIESGNSYIDDDIEEAVFAFKSPSGQLVSYFNVLRKRAERVEMAKHPHARASQSQSHQAPQSQSQSQSQRRSMTGAASVSKAPVNQGRVTPRLVSPTNSSTHLPQKDQRSRPLIERTLSSQLSEVDLNDESDSKSKVDLTNTVELKPVPAEPEFVVDSPVNSPVKNNKSVKIDTEAEPVVEETAKEEPKVKSEKVDIKSEEPERESKAEAADDKETKIKETKAEETKAEDMKAEVESAKEETEETKKEETKVAKVEADEAKSDAEETGEETNDTNAESGDKDEPETESTTQPKAPKKKNKKNKKKN